MKTWYRAEPWRLLAVASLIALACAALSLPRAHDANDSCELTPRQKAAAVKAFKALSPIFQDPRCLNCHGAVNPFSRTGGHGGGHIDIRDEARRFLERPDLRSVLTTGSDPTGAIAARTIQGIHEIAESRVEITDNDLIRLKAHDPMRVACRECHVSAWILPVSHNHFVGRDWQSLCVHMKTSSLTDSPHLFLRHMQDDELVLEGFKGRRGLMDATTAEPPSMPFATMVKLANDWIAAMGGRYHKPPECGCEADGISLEIRHRIQTDPASDHAKAGMAQFDGAVAFDVLLQKPEDASEGWNRYDGEVTVTRPLEVRHVKPSFWQCAGSGTRTEAWRVTAWVDTQRQTMRVHYSITTEDEDATWTCTARGHTITSSLYVDLPGRLEAVEMSAASDAVGRASGRGVWTIQSITLKVIDSPIAP